MAANGTNLLVAGSTASNIDVSKQLADSLPLYLIVVVGLALILLTSPSARSRCRCWRSPASC